MKPVSFERACSTDAENHNDRRFCWWMHFADGFKVGRRTARARQLAAREPERECCEGAAEAPVCDNSATLVVQTKYIKVYETMLPFGVTESFPYFDY